MADRDNYEIGYAKPPKTTQFQKGQSGNPKGRPKGSENMETIIHRTLMEKVRIVVNGVPRMLPKVEVAVTQAANKAAGGDLRALREILTLWRWAESKGATEELPEGLEEPSSDQEVLSLLAARVREQFNAGMPQVHVGGTT